MHHSTLIHSPPPKMEPTAGGFIHDFPPFFRVHNTGDIERYLETDFIPPSHDPQTGVVSKDVVISPENHVSARLYLPRTTTDAAKLPLLIYIHGGGFSIQSAFSSIYHNYINTLAFQSETLIVSIEYRLAPEHPIPACYDDALTALKWIGEGPDPWINEHADFQRVYVAGDSAGANIGHDMVIRAETGPGSRLKFAGLILIHPFFGGDGPDKLWNYICPDTTGLNAFRLNPITDMGGLSKLGCERVLVCLAEKDFLRKRGWNYYQGLKKSDYKGVVEIFETPGEVHVFHLFNPECVEAVSLMKRIVSFIKSGPRTHVMSHF